MHSARDHGASAAIIAGLVANTAIAVTKFFAASHSGSSAMAAEGVHSLIDCADSCLLWYGIRRSMRPADRQHPLGHGQEIYFWALIVALLFFALGGGMSFYEGARRIRQPHAVESVKWNLLVLGASAVFTLGSFAFAFRGFHARAAGRPYWKTFRQSTDPTFYTLVLEDAADLVGVGLAALGVTLSALLARPWIDGAASMAVGTVLTVVAMLLAREAKSLLIGESAQPHALEAVAEGSKNERAIIAVRRPITLVLGPDNILLAMEVVFAPDLSAAEIAKAIQRLETGIRNVEPSIRHIYVEAALVREAVKTAR